MPPIVLCRCLQNRYTVVPYWKGIVNLARGVSRFSVLDLLSFAKPPLATFEVISSIKLKECFIKKLYQVFKVLRYFINWSCSSCNIYWCVHDHFLRGLWGVLLELLSVSGVDVDWLIGRYCPNSSKISWFHPICGWRGGRVQPPKPPRYASDIGSFEEADMQKKKSCFKIFFKFQ